LGPFLLVWAYHGVGGGGGDAGGMVVVGVGTGWNWKWLRRVGQGLFCSLLAIGRGSERE